MTQTDAKRDVTTVLEQAYRGPQALEALLARRDDDFCRPALKLALTVIRDEHNQEDLAKIERLIRRLPFPYNAKFLVAPYLLCEDRAEVPENLHAVYDLWQQILQRSPQIMNFDPVTVVT